MLEGYIKFNCRLIDDLPPQNELIKDLNMWRSRLVGLKLIGMYDSGIGYSNISKRFNANSFIISGTQTGGRKSLKNDDFTLVTDCDIINNSVVCRGRILASSESLTHFAVYSALPDIQSVMHVHSPVLWSSLLHKIPTTHPDIEYGTPAMAMEIINILKDAPNINLIAMAGHEDGLIAFGKSVEEAGNKIISEYLKFY